MKLGRFYSLQVQNMGLPFVLAKNAQHDQQASHTQTHMRTYAHTKPSAHMYVHMRTNTRISMRTHTLEVATNNVVRDKECYQHPHDTCSPWESTHAYEKTRAPACFLFKQVRSHQLRDTSRRRNSNRKPFQLRCPAGVSRGNA